MSIFNFVATSGTQSRNRKRKHPCHRGFLYKRKQKRRVIKKKRKKKEFLLTPSWCSRETTICLQHWNKNENGESFYKKKSID